MKGKTFGILLVAAALLVGVVLLRQGGNKPAGDDRMGAKLFPDLPVNQVTSITIADAKDRVTLDHGKTVWQVVERSGYPADFDALRDMVVKLSRLKIGRSFTGTPESLARLSLLPPDSDAASGKGTAVTLKDAAGKVLTGVILGEVRKTENGGIGGQYLKLAGKDTVYLVDGNFRFLKATPTDWLQKQILDIKGADVRSVAGYEEGAAAPSYRITRPAAGEAATLAPVPNGRTVDTAKIDQVLDALAPLNLDDVQAADAPPSADGTRLVYQLFDGRQITIFPAVTGKDKFTVRVSASTLPGAEADKATAAAAPAEKPSDSQAAGDDAADDQAGTAAEKPPAIMTAQEINDTLGPWIFTIKKWQYDSFITDPQHLLKKEAADKPENAS